MIEESRVEAAVAFIRDSAVRLGELTGVCKALEHKRKVVYGRAFQSVETGTVAEREAKAHTSDEFRSVVEEIQNAWADKTTLETQIRAAELTIETWRSQNKWADRGHF